jgi:hypothetical protein
MGKTMALRRFYGYQEKFSAGLMSKLKRLVTLKLSINIAEAKLAMLRTTRASGSITNWRTGALNTRDLLARSLDRQGVLCIQSIQYN